MSIGVGVIGTGAIGQYHIDRLHGRISGARVTAVCDADADRVQDVAAAVGATAYDDPSSLIADDTVDAVMVTSPGHTHADLVLACIDADIPVLSEKPLATTVDDALRVVEAETARGRRLVQVGFMRRYDPSYQHIRSVIDDGVIGTPLVVHCIHRNPASPLPFTSEMLATDSAVHEIDLARWLLGTELTSATVLTPRRSPLAPDDLADPQLLLLETADGVVVDIEVFVNAQYGYDVRCEVVGSEGTVELETPTSTAVTRDRARRRPVAAGWKERFDRAFHIELAHWIAGLRSGEVTGPSAWDGYAAAATTAACVTALRDAKRTAIELVPRPAFYGTG
jgi:myo-inositol 2-dehydrogenase/D-chiro-inositol 1-dehydrogenase